MNVIKLLIVLTFVLSCGGPKYVNTAKLPDTEMCSFMNEVCKEAEDFERRYKLMSKEEQEDAKNVLSAHKDQCNSALEACQKSK
jgi:hypothetical protein